MLNRSPEFLLTLAAFALFGCGARAGKDDAKMVGRWEADVPGVVQQLANSEGLQVGATAEFTDDGKVEIRIVDGKTKGFQAKGAFALNGSELELNVVPFGGKSPQKVKLEDDGDTFTMESIAGQLTFSRS